MLVLQNIDAAYGAVVALRDVSLEVRAGEIVTLIGPNGAGKSTTLRTISGVLAPAKGRISFNGTNLVGMSPEQIVRLGIAQVPEGRRIFSQLTVAENLTMGAYTVSDRALVEERRMEVYRMFPVLHERQHQLGGTLSGGEQQMLAIGRALMCKPKLLLLDEPSMGLAPMIVKNIFEVIVRVGASGTAILLVEQNARMALKVANRGYVIESGSIVLADEAERLRENDAIRQAYLGEMQKVALQN